MHSSKLDHIDLKLLDAIQKDSSLSNIELAEIACLSPSPCSRRMRILQDKGLIRGQVTLLDAKGIGLPVNVFIQVTLNHQIKKDLSIFEALVNEFPEVMECYLMTGDFDYLIRVAVPDLNAYQQFLEDKLTPIEGINSIRSSFSLKQVQYKTAFPLTHLET